MKPSDSPCYLPQGGLEVDTHAVHVLVCSGLVCTQLSAREKELKLLYTDVTEEVVSGSDYDDMMASEHVLASGTCWGGCSGCHVLSLACMQAHSLNL